MLSFVAHDLMWHILIFSLLAVLFWIWDFSAAKCRLAVRGPFYQSFCGGPQTFALCAAIDVAPLLLALFGKLMKITLASSLLLFGCARSLSLWQSLQINEITPWALFSLT